MREDEFIQETQGRYPLLLSLLTSPAGLHSLLYYLTTPQHPRSADHAFRFPYMACEAVKCNLAELLDAIVGVGKEGSEGRDDGLRTLFSPACPALLAQRSAGFGAAQDRSHPVDPAQEDDPYQLSLGADANPRAMRCYLWPRRSMSRSDD